MTLSKQSCFGNLQAEEIDKKVENLQDKNIIANENKSERIFKEYLQSLGLEDADFYKFMEPELDHYLRSFWFNIRTKKGERYSSSSLEIIRYGLNRALKCYRHNLDITKRESISLTKSIIAYENAQRELKQMHSNDHHRT